jgi:flagellar FliL protein
MADTDVDTREQTAETAPAEKKKGGRKKLVVVVVVLVVVGVAAKMTVLKKPAEEAAGGTTTTLAGGELVPVEAMSVNLADGHYLKIGVAIELVEGEQAKEFEKSGETNKVRDLIISTASTRGTAELSTPEGKAAFKEALDHGASELYEESYHGIYLTDFVMQ